MAGVYLTGGDSLIIMKSKVGFFFFIISAGRWVAVAISPFLKQDLAVCIYGVSLNHGVFVVQ